MKKSNSHIKKFLSILAGIIFALILASPYVFYRNEIKNLSALGYIGLFLSCLISNLSIMLPSSSTVIVVAAASTLNPLLCVFVGGLGTAFGEQASYACGALSSIGLKKEQNNSQKKVQGWFSKRPVITVFLFALLPLPVFDIVGIIAGAKKMKWWKYTLAAALGKTLKFLIVVIGVYYFFPFLIEKIPGEFGKVFKSYLDRFMTRL